MINEASADSSARRISVFFYGLFMDVTALEARGIQPVHLRRGALQRFALRIGRRATLVPDTHGCVHGILMDLTHREIEHLYAEPSVEVYRPEGVIVGLNDGSSVAALCFNLPEPPPADEYNDDYARRLRDLARRLHLPAVYVEEIVKLE